MFEASSTRAKNSVSGFAHSRFGNPKPVLWIVLLIALIAIFGLGSVLEAAFWTLLVIAAVVVVIVLAVGRVIGR